MKLMTAYLQKLRELRSQRGFTMIELLIVISILGILAVAVLSAINPLEQINRGRDTSSQSDAEQLLNAIERFNAFQGHFPWDVSRAGTPDAGVPFTLVSNVAPIWDVATGASGAMPNPDQLCSVLDRLGPGGSGTTCSVGSNEVKPAFIDRVGDMGAFRGLYVYKQNALATTDIYVCFSPQSQAFKEQARQRCIDVAATSSPADYPPAACSTTVTTDGTGNPYGEPMICLP